MFGKRVIPAFECVYHLATIKAQEKGLEEKARLEVHLRGSKGDSNAGMGLAFRGSGLCFDKEHGWPLLRDEMNYLAHRIEKTV